MGDDADAAAATRKTDPADDVQRVLDNEPVSDDAARSSESGRRATIRDVARRAGVSKSLVSLVYASPTSVSPERTRRVLAAAEELGFRRNQVARSLAGRGDFVGILVADLHNPVFAEIVDAARAQLATVGRVGLMTSATLPGDTSSRAIDERALSVFRDLNPTGLLVVGSVPDMSAIADLARTIPTVVASAIPDGLPGVHVVRADDEHGMRLVIDHLRALGHVDIAHVGGEGGLVAEERARQYRNVMVAAGLGERVRIAAADYTEDAGHAAADRLLATPDPPSAIVAVNDLAAVGVLAAAAARAGDTGRRVAVTGWDDSYLAGFREIDLTTVDPRNDEIGRTAAQLVTALADQEVVRADALIEPHLVVRSSTQRR